MIFQKHKLITLSGVAALGLLSANVTAAETILVNGFDDETEAAQWVHWWGAPSRTIEFDPTADSKGNANSGSLKLSVDFDIAAHGGDNQFSFRRDMTPAVDGTQYTNLVMDVRFDPNSPKRGTGDFGYLEFGVKHSDWSQSYFGNATIPGTQTGWTTISAPIPLTNAKINDIAGVTVKMWAGQAGGNSSLTGPMTLWVDNIRLVASTNSGPLPPPKLSVEKRDAAGGLQLIASRAGAQYQRQNIRTVVPQYSWVDAGGPVSYSVTISDYAANANNGFQTHIFLVPGDNVPASQSAPDWSEPNVVFLHISNNTDGRANATFRYKVNQANANGMYWNGNPANGPVGSLGTITAPTAVGTWTLTFTNNTGFTLTGPGGATGSFSMPAEHAALFAGPLFAYVGAQPNELRNIGESVTLSRVQISGVGTPIDETFAPVAEAPGGLNPELWQISAEDAAGVVLVPNEVTFWVSWTLPAADFVPQWSADLRTWNDITSPPVQVGEKRGVLLPQSALNNKAAFFRMVKRPPVQPEPAE
ncbi:MAG TPA: hypothetical protein VEH27_19710 [Methylomirabilota bacterium]|nr:hypothetical protein [Methylomirabilota bacterium]